jgi:hypothetical protein
MAANVLELGVSKDTGHFSVFEPMLGNVKTALRTLLPTCTSKMDILLLQARYLVDYDVKGMYGDMMTSNYLRELTHRII